METAASTKAKIQQYDTKLKQQIASRKEILKESLKELTAEIKKQDEALLVHENEQSKIRKEIAEYTAQIEENEKQIEYLKENWQKNRRSCGLDRLHTTGSPPV